MIISKIIYARFLIDNRANRVFLDIMCDANGKGMQGKLDKLAELGRLPKGFDTKAFAEAVLYLSLMIGIVGVAGTFKGDIAVNKAYLKEVLSDFLNAQLDT